MEQESVLSEHKEQVQYVSWFRKTYPEHRIFAIPNGGYRGNRATAKIVGAKLKAEGVTAGIHDLHCPSLKLWIEMKENKRKKASAEQKEWGQYLESIGHSWFVGYGFEDAQKKTMEFMDENHRD